MKALVVMATALLVVTLRPDPANAWASANRWGGSTTHTWGSTSHTNAWGGSSSHTYGEGTEHTNRYGGRTLRSVWGRSGAHLCLGSDRLSPAWLRRLLRLSRVSPAGRGAILFSVGLLRLRSRCRCRGWRDCRRCRGERGSPTAGICAARRASGLCGFTSRLRLPTPPSGIRMWGHVVCPRLWRQWRLLPRGARAVTEARASLPGDHRVLGARAVS